MTILEIIGLLTCIAMVGVSLMWIATYTTRPNGKVVQKRRAWRDMTESERLDSIAIDGTASVKRRAEERAEKRRSKIIKWEDRP